MKKTVNHLTIVQVKAPWYALSPMLNSAFRKAIPTYAAIDGLFFKAFAVIRRTDGKHFGGVYYWQSEAQALRWFTPKWFATVKERRGVEAYVRQFAVISDTVFAADSYDYQQLGRGAVVLLVPGNGATTGAQVAAGLLRTTAVQHEGKFSTVLFFATGKAADTWLAQTGTPGYERYRVPVLLKN